MYYNLTGLAITIALYEAFLFIAIFTTLLVTGKVVAKRRKNLEEAFEEED